MNPKRKAELQRKLALAPVPRPPAGLADRIKNDIPEYLRPDADRRRMTRSLSFNLRVAASLLVVLSSVLAVMYLLDPEDQLLRMAANEEPQAASVARIESKAADEVQVEITQTPVVLQAANAPVDTAATTTASAAPVASVAPSRRREERADMAGIGGSATGGAAGGVTVDALTIADAAAPAPATAPAPVPPPSAPAAAPQEATRETIVVTAEAPRVAESRTAMKQSFIPEAVAAELDLGSRGVVFGITVDPAVFHNIKQALEQNHRPSAGEVNLEAIVNYFAGAAARPPRRGVKLEVEGSPSPVGGIGQKGFLRFSIDTAPSESNIPVAADAMLEIDFNGKAVEQAMPVGDSTVTGPEPALLQNVSVTGLYELKLQPNLRTSDRVATVRFTYNNVSDGQRRTIERTVYARDFTKLWTRASRRHRLASLGAVWGQSLKVASPAPEVARRAQELATQEPGDERAQELKTAATASSKLTNTSGF